MSTNHYRIVVTNDDGVAWPGPAVLVTHLAEAGHVVFEAAPHQEASGSSGYLPLV